MNRVHRSTPHSRPKKIAVLGSGIASLSAVFELTSQKDWQKKYDITVYQQGWRLGGKCAGGRNPEMGYRNEEPGIYVLLGFYVNMFSLIQRTYLELARSEDHPFATWEDAVKVHPLLAQAEYVGNCWTCRVSDSPIYPGDPSQGLGFLTIWDILHELTNKIVDEVNDFFQLSRFADDSDGEAPTPTGVREEVLAKIISIMMPSGISQTQEISESANLFWRIIENTGNYFLTMMPEDISLIITKALRIIIDNLHTSNVPFPRQNILILGLLSTKVFGFARENVKGGRSSSEIIKLLAELLIVLREKSVELAQNIPQEQNTYRSRVLINLAFTALIGALQDGVAEEGTWEAINDYDLYQWLKKHGASQEALSSSYLTAVYDTLIAYANGNTNIRDCEAGTAIHFLLHTFLLDQGSIVWHLQSGISETIIAPIYQVLRKRGVKFKFFHQVLGLHLDNENTDAVPKKNKQERIVKKITLREQARVKKGVEYDSLIRVNGLETWTTRPRYEQLIEGNDMKSFGLDTESYWADWEGFYAKTKHKERIVTLEHGRDFDLIISGISISALPAIAGELLQDPESERLRNMVRYVRTSATQGLQVWYNVHLNYLGWNHPPPLINGFPNPYCVWAAFASHLQYAQSNPMAEPMDIPKSLMYFFALFPDAHKYSHNPLADSGTICPEWFPPASHHSYHQECLNAARTSGLEFIETQIQYLFPFMHTPQGEVNWDFLANTTTSEEEVRYEHSKRFDAQYWRANVNPSDRGTYPSVGSTKYRIKPDETGYSNLYFVGDWTKGKLGAGCLEDAAISGKMAARSISGQYFFIPGEG